MENKVQVGEWVIEPGQQRVHRIASFVENDYSPETWTVARSLCGTRRMWLRNGDSTATTDSKRFCPKCKKVA